jgi:hypothetical protein
MEVPGSFDVTSDFDHIIDPVEMVFHPLVLLKKAVRADSMTDWKFR